MERAAVCKKLKKKKKQKEYKQRASKANGKWQKLKAAFRISILFSKNKNQKNVKQKEYKQRASKANGKRQMAETKSISNFDFIFEKQKSEKSFNFYMNSCLKLFIVLGFFYFFLKLILFKKKKTTKTNQRNGT